VIKEAKIIIIKRRGKKVKWAIKRILIIIIINAAIIFKNRRVIIKSKFIIR